jgi:predicted transcriptional regulator
MALISVSNECRRVIRESRQKLGLSQGALEKTCRLGKTYVWYVESGKTQSTDPTQLARLLKALHRQAERAKAPTKLQASLLKVINGVEKQTQRKG